VSDKWTVERLADPYGDEIKGLLRNGKRVYCPFFVRGDKNCGSWCPHFATEYDFSKDKIINVVLVCTGQVVNYHLDNGKEDK
jgi:hypothetical protein